MGTGWASLSTRICWGWVEPTGGYYRIATAVAGERERDDGAKSDTSKDKEDDFEAKLGVKAKGDEQEEMAKNGKSKLTDDKKGTAADDPGKVSLYGPSDDEDDEDVDARETHPILSDDDPTDHFHHTGLDDDIDAEMDMYETVEELPDRTASERPPIQHPTWVHSAGGPETLIDLVGRHAKRFATPDSGIGLDAGGVDPPGENKKAKITDFAGLLDEEGYEIV